MKICIMTMNTDDGVHPIAFARRAEEMRNHGVAADKRFRILGERIRAIKSIWAEEEAEFHGEFVVFDPISSWPKPVQQAHPPILIGGWARSPLDRVLARSLRLRDSHRLGDEPFAALDREGRDRPSLRRRRMERRKQRKGITWPSVSTSSRCSRSAA
jgi:alkanesulfonate monooxygenase SsuD/methylene tetrahydromethanopterin reductase-like flavin-dependent oxidoreductase (luciferase family)